MTKEKITMLASILMFATGASLLAIAMYRANPECPPGMVCIDPQRITCFAQDISAAKWLPSSPEQRHFISAKVADKKAEYLFQSSGVDCYELDKHFVLGNKLASFPVEWWRAVRAKR